MKIIILAGGKATRLPKSAKNIPKPLVKVAGKSILQHQIDLLEKHGLTDIRFSLGYRADRIVKYLNGKYEYVVELEPLGTGGAIKFASKDLKEEFMVLNGDILSDIDLKEFMKKHRDAPDKTLGTMAVYYIKNAGDFGLVKIENGIITDFIEKPKEIQSGHINAGIYILSPSIFQNIKKTSFSVEKDIFPDLAKKRRLLAFIYNGFWTDIGTEERLNETKG